MLCVRAWCALCGELGCALCEGLGMLCGGVCVLGCALWGGAGCALCEGLGMLCGRAWACCVGGLGYALYVGVIVCAVYSGV